MAEIASAFVTVAPSAKGFGSKLNSEIGGQVDASGKSSGKRFGAVFAKAGGAIAALGIGVYLKDAIGAASDLAESQSKVGVVFGKSADQILKASKTSASAMGLSKQAYLEATGTLGNLFVSLDLAPKKAANMSQQMVKLAGDMASFNNVSPEEALDALRSGLVGETEPLKRFGVNMNETTLKAQALKMGLVKTTKEALTPQNKALAAQALIMEQTKTAQGDFARTSGGLANQQRILAANFENTKASLGKFLLPLATKAVTGLNSLGGVTRKAGTALKGMFGDDVARGSAAFSSFVEKATPVVKRFGAELVARLLPILKQMGQTFQTVILPPLQRFAAFVLSNVVPIVKQMIAVFVTQVLPVISRVAEFIYGKLVPAIVKIVTQIAGSLRPVFQELFAQIQKTVLPIVTKLLTKFREWWPTIQRVIMIVLKVIGVVLRLAAAILGKVLPPLIRFAGFLIRTVVTAVLAVIGVIVKIIGKLIDFGKWIADGVKKFGQFATAAKNKVGEAIGFIKDLPSKAKDALGDLKDTLLQKGKDLIQGLIDGVTEKIKDLKKKITDALNWVKDHLPGSPIKRGPLKPWNNTGSTGPGGRLMGLLADGIDNSSAVDAAMSRLTARVALRAPQSMLGFDGGTAGASRSGSGSNYNFYTFDLEGAVRNAQRREAFAGGA